MMRYKAGIFLLFICSSILFAQGNLKAPIISYHSDNVDWASPASADPGNAFATGIIFQENGQPYIECIVPWDSQWELVTIGLSSEISTVVTFPKANDWYREQQSKGIESPLSEIIWVRGEAFLKIGFFPYVYSNETYQLKRIDAYTLRIEYTKNQLPAWKQLTAATERSYAGSSVLSTGDWYKIGVNSDGIYHLSYSDLSSLGINVANIDPRNIRLYGNGGGMLPEANASFRHDDLFENAIFVSGESDGSFDASDYILFYGQGPHQWTYNNTENAFLHTQNLYSDKTYYFLTIATQSGKRIGSVTPLTSTPTNDVTSFDDYGFYEAEKYNLIKSGKEWYGEKFDVLLSYDLNDFAFANHDINQEIYVRASVVAKSTSLSSFGILLDGVQVLSPLVAAVPATGYNTEYAKKATDSRRMILTSSTFDLAAEYHPAIANSAGWLDFVEVNVRRMLKFTSGQVRFRDAKSVGSGKVARYKISNAPSSLQVWEVSNPLEPASITAATQSDEFIFTLGSSVLREFVAFDGTSFRKPEFANPAKIANQDLHSLGAAEMIIISHPDFITEADRLAKLHNEQDNYNVILVTPAEIYNEFSSGSQDVTAIRDFIKMIYDKGNGSVELKYVLLFGDGSYDFKARIAGNTNFVPTFQSQNSLQPVASYATDDFFVLMDSGEGQNANGTPDIGIGRFPVVSIDEARAAVDKVEHYTTNGLSTTGAMGASQIPSLGDWRNVLTFVADDQDGNLHLNQAEELVAFIQNKNREYNIDKIYVDAYEQLSTPGGQRYPGVNEAINDRIQKGTLIFNYTGHGGETGLAQERILEVQDINSWTNKYNLAAFVTATCEFSRFDDPERVSAGELCFLSQKGGAIALFTTTRLSFASSNFALNLGFYDKVFTKINGEFPKMGDVIRLAKTPSNPNIRNFVLLGDPALRLAYPQYKVYTSTINGKPIDGQADTLKALSKVTITGRIVTESGQLLSSFNGIIFPSVYDKPAEVITLGNDDDSSPKKFYLQKNLLYKGKASVVNGEFSFTFVVPKDIAYRLDYGRISYYASDGITDAAGFYENILIGGSETEAPEDADGPSLRLFMNDTNFVMHGLTDENPVMLAYVFDSNGVNTVGNGIGHDIVAVLDGNNDEVIVLNDYYESDLDNYKSGTISYPFLGLEEGNHSLELKVWDVYNNSSTAYIEFVVASSGELSLSHLYNYPNPFTGQTYFVFEHNQPGQDLEIDLSIFALDGRLVHNIHRNVSTNGYRTDPIPWNGCSANGAPLPAGFYIYRVSVDAGNGFSNEMSEKLLIVR